MVAEKHSRFVPASYLAGASCPLPGTVGRGLRSAPPSATALSPAEQKVAALVAEGFSNKEICHALDRAEATVKHQLCSAMRKLGVQSRCQLIVLLLTGQPPRKIWA